MNQIYNIEGYKKTTNKHTKFNGVCILYKDGWIEGIIYENDIMAFICGKHVPGVLSFIEISINDASAPQVHQYMLENNCYKGTLLHQESTYQTSSTCELYIGRRLENTDELDSRLDSIKKSMCLSGKYMYIELLKERSNVEEIIGEPKQIVLI